MATKTLTSTTSLDGWGSSTTGTGVYTITYPNSSIEISASTFTVDDLLPTNVTAKLTWWSYGTKGESGIGFYYPTVNNSNAYANFAYSYGSWANGATKTLTKTGTNSATFNTSDYFNSSNPTSRTYALSYAVKPMMTYSSQPIWSHGSDNDLMNHCYNVGWSTVSLDQTLVLNVPPTVTVSAMTYDTVQIYAGLTTASVTLSDLTAYYGGTIASATLTIGNQTATRTTDGVLSIALNAGGTFTPTVTVTDSRGQVTTQTLTPIVVNVYTSPAITYSAERTTSAGVTDDEGTYATIDATLTFADAIATAVAPTVAVTDENGTAITPTVTWYTTRASDGTLSGAVTWSSISSGDTVYGLVSITGGFNTQASYQISITPNDSESAGTAITQTLATAFYTVDFLAGGHGIAFGQPASQTGFYCNMSANFVDANSVMRALFDFVYPVGSYYETSDTSFDPNVTWGGTWSLETEGQVHISSGVNYAVAGALTDTTDGGEATHTLTTDELPAHTHGSKSLSGSATVRRHSTNGSGQNLSGGTGIITISGNGSSSTWNGSTANTSASYHPDILTVNATHEHDSVGIGDAHNNLPPYIIVNRWHRTA